MKTMNRQVAVLVLGGVLASGSVVAAEQPEGRMAEHIGFGGGAVAGAVVAGPVGAIVGATLGVLVGHDHLQQQQLQESERQFRTVQADLELRSKALADRQQQLEQLEKTLAAKRTALDQVERRLAQVQQQRSELQQWISGLRLSVHFDHNSSSVKKHYQTMLDSISAGAAKVAGMKINLEGYTDKAGLADYNLQLSEQRNQRVTEALLSQGLAAERVGAVAHGALSAPERLYAPEQRRVDLQFSFEQPEGLVGLH